MMGKRIAGAVTVAILLGLCLFTGTVAASPDGIIVNTKLAGDIDPDLDQPAGSVATDNSLFRSTSTSITAANTGDLLTTAVGETYDDNSRSGTYEIAPTDDRNRLLVGLDGKNSDGTEKKVTPHGSVLWEQTSGVDDIVKVTQEPSSVLPGESTIAELTVNNSGEDASTGGVQFNTPAGVTMDNIFFTGGIDSGEEKNSTVNIETADSVEPGNYTVTADVTVGTRTDSVSFTVTVTEKGLSRFDQTDSGTIEFTDVISAIEAHNTDAQIGGQPVSFTDVIGVIKAHNQAKSI